MAKKKRTKKRTEVDVDIPHEILVSSGLPDQDDDKKEVGASTTVIFMAVAFLLTALTMLYAKTSASSKSVRKAGTSAGLPPPMIETEVIEDGETAVAPKPTIVHTSKPPPTSVAATTSDQPSPSGPVPSSPPSSSFSASLSSESCLPQTDIPRRYKWKSEKQIWRFPEKDEMGSSGQNDDTNVNPCGWINYNPQLVEEKFRNTTVLFVGDSMVRNIAFAMVASICNAKHWMSCNQRNMWPFQDPDGVHGTTCKKGEDTTNWCSDQDKLNLTQVPLPGLTTDEFYVNRDERRAWWKKGIQPPLMVAEFGQGTRIMVLEAGCVNSNRRKGADGIERMLGYVSDVENREKYPVLKSIDIIVTGGGLHCDTIDFTRKPHWYSKIAGAAYPIIQSGTPIIWLEPTNCYKNGGGKLTLTCPTWIGGAPKFLGKFVRAGMIISPGFFITPALGGNFTIVDPSKPLSDEDAQDPCPFVDPLHVSLRCYRDMSVVHYNTIRWVLDSRANKKGGAEDTN